MRALVLITLSAGALAACDDGVEAPRGSEAAPAFAAANQEIYVCRAVNSLLNPEASEQVEKSERLDQARVGVSYALEGGVSLTTECAFAGDQVTWTLTGVDVPAANLAGVQGKRAPQTLSYRLDGSKVRLTHVNPDGSSTKSTWSSIEVGPSVQARAPAGAE